MPLYDFILISQAEDNSKNQLTLDFSNGALQVTAIKECDEGGQLRQAFFKH